LKRKTFATDHWKSESKKKREAGVGLEEQGKDGDTIGKVGGGHKKHTGSQLGREVARKKGE